MSEYQYHEWQAVDRVLTADEQAAVKALSSHIEASASRAVVTYQWSCFKHDPKQVLLKYFDGYFYYSMYTVAALANTSSQMRRAVVTRPISKTSFNSNQRAAQMSWAEYVT